MGTCIDLRRNIPLAATRRCGCVARHKWQKKVQENRHAFAGEHTSITIKRQRCPHFPHGDLRHLPRETRREHKSKLPSRRAGKGRISQRRFCHGTILAFQTHNHACSAIFQLPASSPGHIPTAFAQRPNLDLQASLPGYMARGTRRVGVSRLGHSFVRNPVPAEHAEWLPSNILVASQEHQLCRDLHFPSPSCYS